jgi:serine/threonine protein kinase
MIRFGKWESVKELPPGAQGKVYLVRDTTKINQQALTTRLISATRSLASIQHEDTKESSANDIFTTVEQFLQRNDPSFLGVLKTIRKPEEGQVPDEAVARMKAEITGLARTQHPNILRVLDFNFDEGWFVGEYQPGGTLGKNRHRFKGNLLRALESFRPLVEGVSTLHKAGMVHRDIKPDNIFINQEGQLILGDLGLIFFADDTHSRVSETFENVGSRDWMPPWAMGMRLDEVRPSFDTFCLGKVLWAMVSEMSVMTLWYYNKPRFSLEKMFPNDREMRWAKEIFAKCVVEEEDECLKDAEALLELVDRVLSAIRRHTEIVRDGVVRACAVCGLGEYELRVDESEMSSITNFGLDPKGGTRFRIFSCTHCGHVQIFHFPNTRADIPKAWKKI